MKFYNISSYLRPALSPAVWTTQATDRVLPSSRTESRGLDDPGSGVTSGLVRRDQRTISRNRIRIVREPCAIQIAVAVLSALLLAELRRGRIRLGGRRAVWGDWEWSGRARIWPGFVVGAAPGRADEKFCGNDRTPGGYGGDVRIMCPPRIIDLIGPRPGEYVLAGGAPGDRLRLVKIFFSRSCSTEVQ